MTSGIYTKYHVQIMLLFVYNMYTTTRKMVCNFHMWVFQIKLKYHCSKPIKLQNHEFLTLNDVYFIARRHPSCLESSVLNFILKSSKTLLSSCQLRKSNFESTKTTFNV